MFSLITDLSESKLFPSTQALARHSAADLAVLCLLYLCAVRILRHAADTETWTQHYCERTIASDNFRRWRTDATDLYAILHGLTDEHEDLRDRTASALLRQKLQINTSPLRDWLRACAHAGPSKHDTERLFVRLDHMLRITDPVLRALRRQVQDWPNLDARERARTLSRLLNRLHDLAGASDLRGKLRTLDESADATEMAETAPRSMLADLAETASCGATGAASIAAVAGGIGAGFDPDGDWGVYAKPKAKTKKPLVIRRRGPAASETQQ